MDLRDLYPNKLRDEFLEKEKGNIQEGARILLKKAQHKPELVNAYLEEIKRVIYQSLKMDLENSSKIFNEWVNYENEQGQEDKD